MTSPGNVFISSVQGDDFDGIRASAREAAEQVGWKVRMAEKTPPSPDTSRETIRRQIAESDVVLVIIGARSGTLLDNGLLVVEDEAKMARELGKDVIFVVQDGVELDDHQRAFLKQIRGDWHDGRWAPKTFGDGADVGLNAVVRGLVDYERRGRTQPDVEPLAREALETILDTSDRANQRIVGMVIDAIAERRGRTDDVSFRTMFDLLCETPAFFGALADAVTEETERIGQVLVGAGYLLTSGHVAEEHREKVIESQAILRRFRDRAGQAHFLSPATDAREGMLESLREALDEMHDSLFERQSLLADVKLALLQS